MKVLKKTIPFCFIALMVLFTVVACSSEQTENKIKTETTDKSSKLNTRSSKTKVQSKAYYYKSMATFEKGTSTLTLDNLATLQGKKVNLVLLYESAASWAEVFNSGNFSTTGDDKLNELIESYELVIIKQFAIDEDNEGIVLESNSLLDNPIEAARKLSLVDNVLMVHVKEVPAVETDIIEESASN